MEETKSIDTPTLDAMMVDETATLKQRISQLEGELAFYKQQVAQIEDLNLSIEIANDRWVKQVNENTTLEIELRKLRKVNN